MASLQSGLISLLLVCSLMQNNDAMNQLTIELMMIKIELGKNFFHHFHHIKITITLMLTWRANNSTSDSGSLPVHLSRCELGPFSYCCQIHSLVSGCRCIVIQSFILSRDLLMKLEEPATNWSTISWAQITCVYVGVKFVLPSTEKSVSQLRVGRRRKNGAERTGVAGGFASCNIIRVTQDRRPERSRINCVRRIKLEDLGPNPRMMNSERASQRLGLK